MPDLVVNESLTIPSGEIRFRFARSGGPGGQHVNKVESSVELMFDLRRSHAFSAAQRDRLITALKSRLDSDGVLRLTVRDSRSQWENREKALARIAELIRRALVPRKKRIKTGRPVAAREKRIAEKRRRAERLKDRRSFE